MKARGPKRRKKSRESGGRAGEVAEASGAEGRAGPARHPLRTGFSDLRGDGIVFCVALAVRLAVWYSIRNLPIVRSPQLDSLEYMEWARRIASGDFAWPVPPPHGPAYPYLLGFLLALTRSASAAALVQAVLGAATCVLAARLGRQFFGPTAGLFAGLLLGLSGVVAFLEVSFYSEGLLLFFVMAALVVIGRVNATLVRAAAAGALIGAAVLTRPTALVLLPIAAWTFFRRAGMGRSGLALASSTFVVAGAVIAPVTLANLRASGAPLLVQGHGGFNFFIGNSPSRDGLPSVRPGAEWDRLEGEAMRHGALRPDAQDSYFVRKTLGEIRASPVRWLRLLGAKLLWTIQAEEIRDPFSIGFFRQQAPILRWLPGFSILFILACVGAMDAARARFRPALLFACVGAWIASDVLLVTSFRYRAPLLPLLAVFAGAGLVALVAHLREGWRPSVLRASVVVASFFVSHLWRHAPSHVFAEEWAATGFALNHERDTAGADSAFRRAIQADPAWSPAWAGLATVEANRGDVAAAERDLKKSIALEPDAVLPALELAGLYGRTNRPREAESEWRRLLALSPREPAALEGLAAIVLSSGRAADAEPIARRAAEVSPGSGSAHLLLARCLGALHRPAEAEPEALRAAELDGGPEAWFTLGMLRLDQVNPASAEEAFLRARAAGIDRRRFLLARVLLLRARRDDAGARRVIDDLLQSDPMDPAARKLLDALEHDRTSPISPPH